MICEHILEIHTVKSLTVLFLTIQFIISQQNQMVPSIAMYY